MYNLTNKNRYASLITVQHSGNLQLKFYFCFFITLLAANILSSGIFDVYWATVCKTVRPMLSDRCLSCPVCLSVCLSVTLVYCRQTIVWIKMKLGMEVGLGPGYTLY